MIAAIWDWVDAAEWDGEEQFADADDAIQLSGHPAGYSQNRDAHGRWAPGDGGERARGGGGGGSGEAPRAREGGAAGAGARAGRAEGGSGGGGGAESPFIHESDVAAWTHDNASNVPSIGYHNTTQEGAASIREQGVDVTRSDFPVYGAGFYMYGVAHGGYA